MISALNMQAPCSDAGGNETRKKSYVHSKKIPQANDRVDTRINDTDSINSPRGPYEVQVGLDT